VYAGLEKSTDFRKNWWYRHSAAAIDRRFYFKVVFGSVIFMAVNEFLKLFTGKRCQIFIPPRRSSVSKSFISFRKKG
jgi:hypothetical protein